MNDPSNIENALAEAMEYKARDILRSYSAEEVATFAAYMREQGDAMNADEWIAAIAEDDLRSRAGE